MDNWNHVLWSDETKINLFGSDGVKHVWRQPGEKYKDKCVLPTVKHSGGSRDGYRLHFIDTDIDTAYQYRYCYRYYLVQKDMMWKVVENVKLFLWLLNFSKCIKVLQSGAVNYFSCGVLLTLKERFTHKWKSSHHLLTFKLF